MAAYIFIPVDVGLHTEVQPSHIVSFADYAVHLFRCRLQNVMHVSVPDVIRLLALLVRIIQAVVGRVGP